MKDRDIRNNIGKEGNQTPEFDIDAIKAQFAHDLSEVAPDLGSNGLSKNYSEGLFNKLVEMGAQQESDLTPLGETLFYHVGKEVLGPLAVQFVHDVLMQHQGGKIVFLARDATPFYHIAKTLVTTEGNQYDIDEEDIIHETFHRKFWGIDDEQGDPAEDILTVRHPRIQKLLSQMGFGSGKPVTIVDVGAWGTMTDHLRAELPELQFNMHFFFSHLPEYISGYINQHDHAMWRRKAIPESTLEGIADTWEGFPKYQKRQETLIELPDGGVTAVGEESTSPYLKPWHLAAIKGLEAAAREYAISRKKYHPHHEILKLIEYMHQAAQGEFTGMLPGHTETWSGGADWRKNWKWGKIPPLK